MDSSTVKKINFLLKASTILPSENHAQKLLKSFYLSKCTKITKNNEEISRTNFSEEDICRKCSTPWFDTNYNISIKPMKMSKNKAKKIRNAMENRANPKKQQIAKKSAKQANNIITTTCNLCHNQNEIILWKKTANLQFKETKKPKITPIPNTMPNVEVKKKKRKKDQTAGLLIPPKNSNVANPTTKLNVMSKSQSSKPNNKPATKKPTIHLVSIKKPQNQAQKKNSLLQLVNALKSKNDTKNGNNTKNDTLKRLLN